MISIFIAALVGVFAGLPLGYLILKHKVKKVSGTEDCYGNPIGNKGYLETNISKITSCWLDKSKNIDSRDIGKSFAKVLHQDLKIEVVKLTCEEQELSQSNTFQYRSRIQKMIGYKLNHYHHEALNSILNTFDEYENNQFIMYFLDCKLVDQSEFRTGNF